MVLKQSRSKSTVPQAVPWICRRILTECVCFLSYTRAFCNQNGFQEKSRTTAQFYVLFLNRCSLKILFHPFRFAIYMLSGLRGHSQFYGSWQTECRDVEIGIKKGIHEYFSTCRLPGVLEVAIRALTVFLSHYAEHNICIKPKVLESPLKFCSYRWTLS